MPYRFKVNLKGPKGDTGPHPSLASVFVAAWPVGSIMERADILDPNEWGGTWVRLDPVEGRGRLWKRTN